MSNNPQAKPFVVAAAQAAPHFLDREKTVQKACDLIAEAGKNDAKLIVFPEAFVSGYPDWVWVVPNGNAKLLDELYSELVASAVSIPDESTQKLCQAAKEAGIYVTIGIHERNSEASGASLFNTILYIDNQGDIMGKHRKLIPTGGERLIWGQGDGSTLSTFDTELGKLGGLLCWENYMPLARQAYLLDAFRRAITEDVVPETTGADNLKSLGMVFGAVEAVSSGNVVRLPLGD